MAHSVCVYGIRMCHGQIRVAMRIWSFFTPRHHRYGLMYTAVCPFTPQLFAGAYYAYQWRDGQAEFTLGGWRHFCFRSTSVSSALEVFTLNTLYKFTFDLWYSYKSQTPLHGHWLQTPATDTTNGQAHNNSTTLQFYISTCQDVGMWQIFCPLVVFVGGVRSWCS